MRKLLLSVTLAAMTVGYAFAEFPALQFELPATYLPSLTQASMLNTVTLGKQSWSDKQELKMVEDAEKAYMVNLESDEKILATDAVISGTGAFIKINYTFPDLTANGEYEVVIPAGSIMTVEGGEKNEQFSHVYTLADPNLSMAKIEPVTLTPAPGTALKGVNSTTGTWTVAFAPEIQSQAGYMRVEITDADPGHIYEDEAYFSQIQINRLKNLATGEDLDMDLTQPFSFTWGGKEGSGLMYQGYEYKCRFEVRKSEYNEARDGKGEVLGVYECTYVGNTMPEQYADINLINVTPTPADYDPANPDGYIFETTNDPHVTLSFDKPVEPNLSLCGVNTGSGTSVPFEGDAVSSDEGKTWRFTIPKNQIATPSVYVFFAFKDPETGLVVKGNSGRGANSTFQFEWNVEIGLPTLSVVSPDPETELNELSSITLTNSENYYYFANGAPDEVATIQTMQGEVIAQLNYNNTTFDNSGDPKTATLNITPAITEPGSYVLVVPKGYFTLSQNEEIEQMETVYKNKALTVRFSVVGASVPETMNAKFTKSNPENGSVVTSLKEIEIFFDIPEGAFIGMDYDMTRPDLMNQAGESVAKTDITYSWDANNIMVVTLDKEVTDPGVYTLSFPDKFFLEDQTTNYTPAFTLTWTIDGGSGVNSVEFENAVAGDVYSVDGKLLIRNAKRGDLGRLGKGIYLIGGKKYTVK